MTRDEDRCAECGAAQTADTRCLDCFHALLAFENERPPAFGAVHHLTVACYYLQHPTGYAPATLEMWRQLLADSLSGRATVKQLLERARRKFEGPTRAREPGAAAPPGWPAEWPMTGGDVIRPDETPSIEAYVGRAMAWARATSDTLGGTVSATTPALPRR
jgi:uncharacterized protein DUF5946